MGSFQKLCLRWNNHTSNLLDTLNSLLTSQQHSDVTLACQGEVWHLHRLVLSASSSHFAGLLADVAPGQSPLIIVDGPTAQDIAALIRFIYHGEVSVDQEHLPDLLKTATALKIKGLADFPIDSPSCLSTVTNSSAVPDASNRPSVYESRPGLPPKKIRIAEYNGSNEVPLNLSNKRSRFPDSGTPKDFSFKKRIIQEECREQNRASNLVATNVVHHAKFQQQQPSLRGSDVQFVCNTEYLKESTTNPPFNYVRNNSTNQTDVLKPKPYYTVSEIPVDTLQCHDAYSTTFTESHNHSDIPKDNRSVSGSPSEAYNLLVNDSKTSPPHTTKLPLVVPNPSISIAEPKVISIKEPTPTHPVPLIKRYKSLDTKVGNNTGYTSLPTSSQVASTLPSPAPSMVVQSPGSQVTLGGTGGVQIATDSMNHSPTGKKKLQEMLLNVPPQYIVKQDACDDNRPTPLIVSTKQGTMPDYKFIPVKTEDTFESEGIQLQADSVTKTIPFVSSKLVSIKEELNHMKNSSSIVANSEMFQDNLRFQVNPILSSAFLSTKTTNVPAATLATIPVVTNASIVKFTSAPLVIAGKIGPQTTVSSPQQLQPCTSSILVPLDQKTVGSSIVVPSVKVTVPQPSQSVCSPSSVDTHISYSTTPQEQTQANSSANTTAVVTTTTIASGPATTTAVSEAPATSTSQRVSVNMRTFKEEWRRQLLVDYDPSTNMSICMLCFTTFKSYDGPRKNTYVKHAKRFHPILEEYSEEERDLIIENYEKQYKHDVDMQKEVNKTFRGGMSGGCGARANKTFRAGQTLPMSAAVSGSSASSTGSGSLPGSRPDTDGEDDGNAHHPGKSRSGTPDSDASGDNYATVTSGTSTVTKTLNSNTVSPIAYTCTTAVSKFSLSTTSPTSQSSPTSIKSSSSYPSSPAAALVLTNLVPTSTSSPSTTYHGVNVLSSAHGGSVSRSRHSSHEQDSAICNNNNNNTSLSPCIKLEFSNQSRTKHYFSSHSPGKVAAVNNVLSNSVPSQTTIGNDSAGAEQLKAHPEGPPHADGADAKISVTVAAV